MAMTAAQIRATKKYQAEHYDIVSALLPKGTKQRIKDTGATVSAFIAEAVCEKLDGTPRGRAPGAETGPQEPRTQGTEDDEIKIDPAAVDEFREYGDPQEIVDKIISDAINEYRAGLR